MFASAGEVQEQAGGAGSRTVVVNASCDQLRRPELLVTCEVNHSRIYTFGRGCAGGRLRQCECARNGSARSGCRQAAYSSDWADLACDVLSHSGLVVSELESEYCAIKQLSERAAHI